MVLRVDALRKRLLKLEEIVSRLETFRRKRKSPSRDFRDEWALERGLQLGAETILDIGNHVLSAHFGVSPEDYEDVVRRLADHGVIDDGLRERLKGLAGFRNILVHDYLRIDPERVAAFLAKAPEDFADFGRALRDWLERAGGPGRRAARRPVAAADQASPRMRRLRRTRAHPRSSRPG